MASRLDRPPHRPARRHRRPCRRSAQEETIPLAKPIFYDNIAIGGGPAPARAYIEEVRPDVLEGRIEPGRDFDHVIGLDEVPDGHRAMNERESIKVMIAL